MKPPKASAISIFFSFTDYLASLAIEFKPTLGKPAIYSMFKMDAFTLQDNNTEKFPVQIQPTLFINYAPAPFRKSWKFL